MKTEGTPTPGPWYRGTNGETREWMQIYSNGKMIATAKELSKKGERKATDFEEEEANARLIAHAPELFEMVRSLKDCIRRLTQDDLTQEERDKEAQWEGEAHELLIRANPNYYKNANTL